MKIASLPLVILIIACVTINTLYSQGTPDTIREVSYEQIWVVDHWTNNNKVTAFYVDPKYPLSQLWQTWSDDQYVDLSMITYKYNPSNMITESMTQQWVIDKWVNAVLNTYNYNEKGLITQHLNQIWDTTQWMNLRRTIYEYDDKDHLILEQHEDWASGAWLINSKLTFSYDQDGNQSEKTLQLGPDQTNQTKNQYTYDEKGKLNEDLEFNWSGEKWEQKYKVDYAYNQQGLVAERIKMIWQNDGWRNQTKFVWAYNEKGSEVDYTEYYWITDWSPRRRITNQYDGEGRLVENMILIWLGEDWGNYERTYYEYYTSVEDGPGYILKDITVSPNPAHTNLKVTFSESVSCNLLLEIINIRGMTEKKVEIKNSGFMDEFDVPLDNLQAGMYVLKIGDGKNVKHFKIILD